MRRFAAVTLGLLLAGCSVLQGTPRPAPPPIDRPQEISRNQTGGLQRLGSVSVTVRGAPSDAEDAIRLKAAEARADYYVIIMVEETVIAGRWYSQAILYRR